MPLVLATLKSGISSLFTDFPQSHADAGARWADAYAAYAASGVAIAGGTLTAGALSAGKATLASSLASLFASSQSAADFAPGFAAAFTAFWLSPPVVFIPTPPSTAGLAASVTGTAALQTAILSAPPAETADAAIDYLAGALDVFTKTVLGTFVQPTPPTPLIIPLT